MRSTLSILHRGAGREEEREKEEERKEREWKVVERGIKKRKVEVDLSTAPVGPRLWRGSGAVVVSGGVVDVVLGICQDISDRLRTDLRSKGVGSQ